MEGCVGGGIGHWGVRCCSAARRPSQPVQCKWPSASSWPASSAWWLSMRASLTTTSSGFWRESDSMMLPEPAWEMISAAPAISSAIPAASVNRKLRQTRPCRACGAKVGAWEPRPNCTLRWV